MNEPLLRVEHIKKYFTLPSGRLLKAVDDLSFSVRTGETIGIIGESGCGKSTLARVLAGMITPTAGNLYFKGQCIPAGKRNRNLRRAIHLVFQDSDSAFDPRMSVRESLKEALYLSGQAQGEDNRRIAELLQQVGLENRYVHAYPSELSGGQRQRAAIARALATRPQLLIADEPVASLDVSIQAQIINLLADLQEQEKFSMLFIAHDLAVVRHISDRTLVMLAGKIMEIGPTEDLFTHPAHVYTQLLSDSILPAKPHKESIATTPHLWGKDISAAGCLQEIRPGHYVRREI